MPTIIGQEVPPDFAGVPRRISSEDLTLWYRFRATQLTTPQRLLFDVGVGAGKPTPEDTTDQWKDYWLRETQRRIDVLIIENTRQIIIELRTRALANALGRLLVYRALYLQDPLSTLPLALWLVTDTPDPELARLFDAQGIRWIVV